MNNGGCFWQMTVFGAVWGAAVVVFQTEGNQRVQAVGVLSQITLVLMTTAMCTLSFSLLEMLLLHLNIFTFLRPPALLPVSEPDSTASSLHTLFDHTSPPDTFLHPSSSCWRALHLFFMPFVVLDC